MSTVNLTNVTGKNTAVVEPRSGILARGGRERKVRNFGPDGIFFF